ncbi:MAG: response regulator [Nitrincola sp.]|nr:response regulator [Nitrincola sp.]
MFAVLALLTLIVGVITFFIIRHLVRPLKTSADQIASMLVSEEKIYPIPVIRRDEVGVLVSALNQLIEKQEIQASQLEVEKIKAEAASQAKSDFLANMSHEIRTPLNAIIGLSELQTSADLPPEFSQRNEQIIRSSHLLLGIVNDLLDFSKIESGKMQMHRQPFAIDQIVDQLKILFSNQAISKGVELRFLLDEKLPQCLIGDNLRLTQILINLVSNALKFTEKGFVELSIQIMKPYSSEDTGVKLHFRVRDTGIGIDKEHQKLLFASFSQADSSITRRHGGTGLGLAISKRLVELLGGDGISLESEPNVGSVFEFDLAFATCSEDEADSIRTVQLTGLNHRSTKEWRSFCGQHVLVVEDHPINQQMVKAQLERMGLKVSLADNGVQGVERVKAESFDLVLMDIQMPVMDGYRATEAIREFNTEIPIIALTAAALVEDKRKALDVGMNDHLGKPFSTEELYQQLVSWLETRPIASGTEKNATATESSLDTLDATLQPVESPFPVTMPVQKHKILIVDDMPANIKNIGEFAKG